MYIAFIMTSIFQTLLICSTSMNTMLSGWIKSYQRAGLNRFHPYHMVKPSIWPFLTSFSLLFLVVSMISTFYETNKLSLVFHIGSFNIFFIVALLFLFVNMFGW